MNQKELCSTPFADAIIEIGGHYQRPKDLKVGDDTIITPFVNRVKCFINTRNGAINHVDMDKSFILSLADQIREIESREPEKTPYTQEEYESDILPF